MLDADAIRALIPHAGRMCLLDQVLAYDPERIVCSCTSHTSDRNPLRTNDGLSAVHAIEYGAQAMALHGALLGGAKRPGYIVAVREVQMNVDWLHEILGPVRVTAKVLMRDERAATYRFLLEVENETLVVGHLSVALTAEALR
jgi:predicted hotdog family 3-hydroxylacyl-ACP dehydratase